MEIIIKIGEGGKVTAEVLGGHGPVCISEVLAGLEALLGGASNTELKPEYWQGSGGQASEEVRDGAA